MMNVNHVAALAMMLGSIAMCSVSISAQEADAKKTAEVTYSITGMK